MTKKLVTCFRLEIKEIYLSKFSNKMYIENSQSRLGVSKKKILNINTSQKTKKILSDFLRN